MMKNDGKVIIIAEAGVNHNGDIALAKKLAVAAKKAGADIVKFQTFKAERLASVHAGKAKYQKQTTSRKESQLDMLKKLELSVIDHKILIKLCRTLGIVFLSTPFDEESVDLLDALGVPMFKIPSGEITNLPFLKHIAQKGKPILLSTGMSTMAEVRDAMREISKCQNKDVTLLHCTTEYPAPIESANLRAIAEMRRTFKVPVGLSDHTVGIEAALGAVALGAVVIEKHITLDKRMKGPDHRISMEPQEFQQLVESIHAVELALGSGEKKPQECELKNLPIARKSLVAATDIRKGQRIQLEWITRKRPGNGIPPKHFNQVAGKIARRDISKDSVLTWSDLK